MCDKEINNKHITRYQKFIYSNKSRYSRFTNVDKFDLCPRCDKFLNKMMIKMREKIKESEQMSLEEILMTICLLLMFGGGFGAILLMIIDMNREDK